MEIWLIVGIEFNSVYRNTANGSSKDGITLHMMRDAEAGTGVSGQETRKQFLGNDTCKKFSFAPEIGASVLFDFDRNGLSRLEIQR